MTEPADLIEVRPDDGQTDRIVPGQKNVGAAPELTVTIRRWHEPESEVCWVIISDPGGGNAKNINMTRDQLRALGVACIQAATGTGEA